MTKILRRVAFAALLLAPFAVAAPAQAQTDEGTVITNTATATYTDANGNTYTPATASVTVTVGYKAAPDVTSPASVTPSSPSTGNEIAFTVTNKGNGADSVTVATTAASGVTITGYKIGSTTYATLADLNLALAGTSIAKNTGTVVVTVVYTVAPGQGGQTIPVSLTATSRRTPAATGASDSSTTNVIPAVAASVVVTPDAAAVNRLPSGTGPTTYTETFTVQNTGNRSDTFTLSAGSSDGTVVSIVSVDGTAGTGGSITLAPGASGTVTVVYTVSNSAAAGATSTIGLTATSGNGASQSDSGSRVVTVIRAAISMTKQAYLDNQTTELVAADRVLPGQYIQYKITVTNTGGAAATLTGTGYGISDPLPSQVTYVSASGDAAGWTISETSGTVSAALTGTLAPAASRFFWIRVQVK
jgi:uncharacterized repeat protein (TIGR01451 family)